MSKRTVQLTDPQIDALISAAATREMELEDHDDDGTLTSELFGEWRALENAVTALTSSRPRRKVPR